jgi:hypothetical protein
VIRLEFFTRLFSKRQREMDGGEKVGEVLRGCGGRLLVVKRVGGKKRREGVVEEEVWDT